MASFCPDFLRSCTTEPKDRLLALCSPDAGVGASSILMAGAVSVLGLPLGVGQGSNPTCQAARGLSLWSQHAPGLLLGMIATAVRDGFVRMDFENQVLRSDQLLDTDPSRPFDADLDPVSAVLVPHLDRIYARMIQRIVADPDGKPRVYFFNPNNEGRQRWGHGVAPTVWGHGEFPGESSLPFAQFTSRLYAFHFDPYEEGEAYAVPEEVVEQVSTMARESWGRAVTWVG